MVRPRASDRNVAVAVGFGSLVVVRTDEKQFVADGYPPVSCNGRKSIFAVFASCLPELARDAADKHPTNRQGVTAVELNKALHTTGLKSVRRQERLDGGDRWRPKVWSNCRWLNPMDPADLDSMARKFATLQRNCPELGMLTPSSVQSAIARVLSLECDGNESDEKTSCSDGSSSDVTPRQPSKRQCFDAPFATLLPPIQTIHQLAIPETPNSQHYANLVFHALSTYAPAGSAGHRSALQLHPAARMLSPPSTSRRDAAAAVQDGLLALANVVPYFREQTPPAQPPLPTHTAAASDSCIANSDAAAPPRVHARGAEERGRTPPPGDDGAADGHRGLLSERVRLQSDRNRLAGECSALRAEREALLARLAQSRPAHCAGWPGHAGPGPRAHSLVAEIHCD